MSGSLGVWLAAFVTLGLYSFLWKENPWYRLIEQVYVGISVAHLAVVGYFNIREMALRPLAGGSWTAAVPVALGLLLYTRWIPRLAFLSRISIAFTMGVTSGVVVTGTIKASFIDQVLATMQPVRSVNNAVFLLCTFCATAYFLFLKKTTAVTRPFSEAGKWTLMVAFGSAFGYTVMSRISLFTGRLQFLFGQWIKIIK